MRRLPSVGAPASRSSQGDSLFGTRACTRTLVAYATNVRVQARVPKSESPWLERDAGAPTLGSLRIAAAPAEYPISADQRSVCLDVANWSVDDTLAVRVIVEYAFEGGTAKELTAAAPTSNL